MDVPHEALVAVVQVGPQPTASPRPDVLHSPSLSPMLSPPLAQRTSRQALYRGSLGFHQDNVEDVLRLAVAMKVCLQRSATVSRMPQQREQCLQGGDAADWVAVLVVWAWLKDLRTSGPPPQLLSMM